MAAAPGPAINGVGSDGVCYALPLNAGGTAVVTTGGGGGGGAVTIADGADVTQGAIADVAVATDATGTVNAHLRGLVKLLAACISIGSGWMAVSIQNATLAVTQSGSWVLSAGTALIGAISASSETSTIYSGTTALTPKFAVITASSSGATTLVAAVSSKKIRVTNIVLIANAAVNVKFQSHVTPTDKTGLLYLAANTGFAPGFDQTGHFETIAGEALDINLSGAVAVGGWLKYIEV